MSSTSKVLGTIGALNTLIENFPMSLLDLMRGKTYTSSFEFIMDLLYACGVNTNEIVEFLLNEIYAITPNLEDGLENFHNDLTSKDFTQIKQSPFLETLEEGIKGILKALLASMYGCSAIPVLPNKVMDYPSSNYFPSSSLTLWDEFIYPATFDIPARLIDPMGILEKTPTTSEGRIYYDIPGRDILYKKVKKTNILSLHKGGIINNAIFLTEKIINGETLVFFNTENELPEKINITIGYLDEKMNNLLRWESCINIANKESNDSFIIKTDKSSVSKIKWIKINGCESACVLAGNIKCYLSFNFSNINSTNLIYNEIKWYEDKNIVLTSNNENSEYEYQVIEIDSENFKNAIRKKAAPVGNITESDPEYIIVYDGIKPNNLYNSFDLNAFIWYTLNNSSRASQIEINHTMWDSRNSALRQGVKLSNEDWNNWYSSKQYNNSEFLYKNNPLNDSSALYPIIQLKKSPKNLYGLNVSFPSQRYYKPRTRLENNPSEITFNATIYRFNKEYLENIQILKPKIMISGFVNYMLGFAMDALNSVNVNFTKKVIENKLSSAIEKIIEADDMEIEDCYTTFSNEEFDSMLEEMLLSRYNATYYGGNTNKVKTHNVDYYMSLIDSFNSSTTKEESIEKITKLINEISVSPGKEGSIDYGVEISIDTNFLRKLLWAITMPIAQTLFTPQVMLLIIVNMSLTGVVKKEDFANNDFGKILNLLINKILGLMKSIVKYVKDKVLELLLKLFMSKVTPLLVKYMGALERERLEYWINVLLSALACLPTLPVINIRRGKIGGIDDVDYADIIPGNTLLSTPETTNPC